MPRHLRIDSERGEDRCRDQPPQVGCGRCGSKQAEGRIVVEYACRARTLYAESSRVGVCSDLGTWTVQVCKRIDDKLEIVECVLELRQWDASYSRGAVEVGCDEQSITGPALPGLDLELGYLTLHKDSVSARAQIETVRELDGRWTRARGAREECRQ